MIEIEEELRAHLRRRAGETPVGHGWEAVQVRIARRRRNRQRARTALTLTAVVVLSAGAASLVGGRDGTPVATAPATGLPRLVFDVPGYPPTHVAEAGPEQGGPAGPATGSIRLSVLLEPDRGYDGRVLFLSSVAAGASFGFGELDPNAARLPVGASTAYLREAAGTPVRTLGWLLPTGQGVYLVGVRLTGEELVSVARAVSLTAGGDVVFAAGVVPAGLMVQRTTVTSFEPRAQSSVSAGGNEDRLSLRLQAGGAEVLDNLVADRVASALEVAAASVGGVPAVYTGADGGPRAGLGTMSVIWQVQPGVVAELVADGDARRHLVAAAESLTAVSEARWRVLVARTAPKPVPAVRDGLDPAQAAHLQVCNARSAWLDARGVSDLTTQSRVVNNLRELVQRGEDAGLGQNSDLLVVMRKLADAMTAGDVATVQATPAGGCP